MRLGLTSSFPRMGAQTSTARHSPPPPSRASSFTPIDVDGDSTDDAEPSSHNRPSLSTSSATLARTLHYESSDDSESKQSEHKDDAERSRSRSVEGEHKQTEKLHFFFQYGDRATPKKRRRDAQLSGSSAQSSPAKDELHEVICAARTNICGEKFDRCEMEFQDDRVELTIWQAGTRKWQGEVRYAHLGRFCFSKVDRPPYILLLQLDGAKGRSRFADYYDSVFARVCSRKNEKEVVTPMFGVVLYFDEEMDVMRCQSMRDSNPRLSRLFSEKLSESEVRDFSKWDAAHKLRLPRRVESKSSMSSKAGGRLASIGRQAIGSMKMFFAPRSSVLEADSNPSVVNDHGEASRGRTLLSRESNGVARADSGEAKAPIQFDDAIYDKQDCESAALADRLASSSLEQDGKTSDKVESRKRAAAAARREDEKLKRRRIESRRNEVLLTYPYDGSDTAGRISVTLGDVDRLVPGEFLNDNIIDFYLRFLWRHLPPWQQEQTYFFTSHFFTQLNGTNGAHELTTADPDERFARVARWTQKEANLFEKKFLFIPINDSFHWSIAVFCNPGSAIIKKHRRVRRRRRANADARSDDKVDVVDLVDGDGGDESAKTKFAKMLRNYLECEWKARFASSAVGSVPKEKTAGDTSAVKEEETIVTSFDSEGIGLLEPNIPLQSNSSDCGVFLLMYAASIVRLFPAGVRHEDQDSNLKSTLTSTMFRDEHVLEFREYLHQLLFSLQFLERHGLPEEKVKEEELEVFTID
ncbi:hypothetical protein PF010_g14372 [Phytophthora fragariae]|uniref:Ubiquitin-like protease family profile domain-containing protein n=1 Tax=Phytophthora fragariae TaxID=53985 RepID=A0A6A3RPV4_9STRA|nr:hypothetical protein PF009_g16000 [Phytophthora fragariae]KAE9101486.1 hypothetical protein PF007_g15130 [Phytophthora fragariae]KAE9101697.1 hypothetical protein PF010_g14372 [Phytophthora fragariae]KAE9218097.1 hypothetical protein PF004_g13968 [Phytophthora fragariae]KAE9302032.1 hypothetical protein PF001_g14185 [Phytophthora fragariae]